MSVSMGPLAASRIPREHTSGHEAVFISPGGTLVFVDTIELLPRRRLFHPIRTWILFQAENIPVHLLSDLRIELTEVPLSGGSDFYAIGPGLNPTVPA
jgi:hypothetical protein